MGTKIFFEYARNRLENPIDRYNAKATLDELVANEKMEEIYKAKTNLEKQSFRYSNLLIEENDILKIKEIEGKLRILRTNIDKSQQEFHDFFVSTVNEKHSALRFDQKAELIADLKNRYIENQTAKEYAKNPERRFVLKGDPILSVAQTSFASKYKGLLATTFASGNFLRQTQSLVFTSSVLSSLNWFPASKPKPTIALPKFVSLGLNIPRQISFWNALWSNQLRTLKVAKKTLDIASDKREKSNSR